MATTRPFAYNPTSASIFGIDNFGTLSVGAIPLDYSGKPGGLTWWMGPDEDTGYVIGIPVTTSNFPTPLGNIGTVNFFRTNSKNDSEFIALSQLITGQTFASAVAARTYLISNNYWTSYLDADAQTFITSAAITNPTQKIAINNLVTNLKLQNLWTKMTAVYPIVGGNATAHSKNLINPSTYPISFSSGWTHTSEGMQAATANSGAYADTGIAIGATTADAHISVYCASDEFYYNTLMGIEDGYDSDGFVTTNRFDITLSGTKGYVAASDIWHNHSPDFPVGSGNYNTSFGHFINTTTGNRTSIKSYINGVLKNTAAASSGVTSSLTLFIGNSNYAGGLLNSNSTSIISFSTVGSSLTDADSLNLATTIEKFQNALSRGKAPVNTYDPDLMSFLIRVYTAGGTVSKNELSSLITLISYLKDTGLWTKLSAFYPMVGGTSASCAQNLISSSFTGTFSSGWTFDYTGALPNGTSAYMNTNFNFLDHGIDNNSGAFGVYLNTSRTAGSKAHGSITVFTPCSYIFPYSGTSMVGGINDSYLGQSIVSTDSLGFFQTSRISLSGEILSKNGSNTTLSSSANARDNRNLYLGAANVGGSPGLYDNTKIASAYVTKYSLSSTDLTNMYTGVHTFNTTLARPGGKPIFTDPDVNLFFNRVYAAGGTATGLEAVATNALVLELKAKGVWSKMKAMYPFIGASSAAAAQNLISASYTGTFSGTWTYSSAGVKSGGGYFNTGFIPNTDASINGVSFGGVFNGSSSYGSSNQTFGAYTGTSFGNHMYFQINTYLNQYQKQLVMGGSSAGGQGLTSSSLYGGSYAFIFRRTSSTFAQAYYSTYGGTATSFGTITASTISLPTNAFYFGALNLNGTTSVPVTDYTNAITFLGLDLTDQQAKDLNTAMYNFRYLLGR